MSLLKRHSHGLATRAFAVTTTSLLLVAGILSFNLVLSGGAQAQTALSLGTSGNFAVLAGSTVTNTGASVLTSNLALTPGSSVTGFPPGIVNGAEDVANTAAQTAQTDLTAAYNQAAGEGPVSTVSAATLGAGQTLSPGVYNSSSTIDLSGALTLDGGGSSASVFIFQAGSALNVANSASIVLTNGAQAGCVFWQVTSSATIGTSAAFAGSVLALSSITANTGATVNGRLLARNGAVTLDDNVITIPATCSAATSGATTTSSVAGAGVGSSASTTTMPPSSKPPKKSSTTTTIRGHSTGTLPVAPPSPTVNVPAEVTG